MTVIASRVVSIAFPRQRAFYQKTIQDLNKKEKVFLTAERLLKGNNSISKTTLLKNGRCWTVETYNWSTIKHKMSFPVS